MNYYEKKAIPFIEKIKNKIGKKIKKGKYKESIELIKVLSEFLYQTNQYFVDEELENYTQVLSDLTIGSMEIDSVDDNKVLFYDGFGLDNRGLAQIYLKALARNGYQIIYVVDEERKPFVTETLSLISNNGSKAIFVKENDQILKAQSIKDVVVLEKPKSAFFYSTPNDVSGIMAFESVYGKVKKYLINLTDHAYWLGAKLFDYIVEFRDYGADISSRFRKVSIDKIIKLPFYPNVNTEQEFLGFPFDVDLEKQRVFFSGGALYKTFGDNDRYYKLVEKILQRHSDLVFWYGGSGDFSKLENLKQKFPKRVYYTTERKDLYQLLTHCAFYLSTYPICGGLMFQYSAVAKKVPITLHHDDISSDFLINQSDLLVEFDTEEELLSELDKMLTDDRYLKQKEDRVFNSVLTEEQFNVALDKIIKGCDSGLSITYKESDINKLTEVYIKDFNFKKMAKILATKNVAVGLKYYPIYYVKGALGKIKNQLRKK